jgi:hypothetical protein
VTLDDETLASAKLTGALTGGSIAVSMKRPPKEVDLIARILRSGPLSFRPGDVTTAEDPGA